MITGRRPIAFGDEFAVAPLLVTRFHTTQFFSQLFSISKAAFHPVCDTNSDNDSQAKCQSLLNYGESEDPAKMTYSKLDLIKRGLCATTPSAKMQ